jgi:transcriptional regulator with XRE-family HTH domain
MISAAQIRAARALIGITAEKLARSAHVGFATIKRFELGEGILPSRSGTLERVKAALEAAGIEFIGDPIKSPGVRLRTRSRRRPTYRISSDYRFGFCLDRD